MPVVPPLLLPPSRAFVDSGAYLALLNENEQRHRDAATILESLTTNRYRQFTTNAILFEGHALILSRLGIAVASQFVQEIRESRTVIVRVSADDEVRAEEILFRYSDKDISFTDALSFSVMERLHIAEAFTFDQHFAQYGFHALWEREDLPSRNPTRT